MLAVVGPGAEVGWRVGALGRGIGCPADLAGTDPMLVSPTLASAMVPLSRRTMAATPTTAHAWETRLNFS